MRHYREDWPSIVANGPCRHTGTDCIEGEFSGPWFCYHCLNDKDAPREICKFCFAPAHVDRSGDPINGRTRPNFFESMEAEMFVCINCENAESDPDFVGQRIDH